MQEAWLIKRCQAGDADAFEALMKVHEQRVYTIAYRYIGNAEDASDLTQEAFIKAWKSIRSFRGDSSFATWIGRIVRNTALDELRKRTKFQVESIDEEVNLEEGSVLKELVSKEATPEEQYLQKEQMRHLSDAISQLGDVYRVAVVMRELDGLSYEEIATQMGCSVGTVKSRIHRGKEQIREIMKGGVE